MTKNLAHMVCFQPFTTYSLSNIKGIQASEHKVRKMGFARWFSVAWLEDDLGQLKSTF